MEKLKLVGVFFGVFQESFKKPFVFRTVYQDVIVDEIEMTNDFWAGQQSCPDPFKPFINFLSSYLIEADFVEVTYSKDYCLAFNLADRVYTRAILRRRLSSEKSTHWMQTISFFRKHTAAGPQVMVSKSKIRFGPSFILSQSIHFAEPKSLEDTFFYWTIDLKASVKAIEFYMTDGSLISGAYGKLALGKELPPFHLALDGKTVESPEQLYQAKSSKDGRH
jgi:hypothetical protein